MVYRFQKDESIRTGNKATQIRITTLPYSLPKEVAWRNESLSGITDLNLSSCRSLFVKLFFSFPIIWETVNMTLSVQREAQRNAETIMSSVEDFRIKAYVNFIQFQIPGSPEYLL